VVSLAFGGHGRAELWIPVRLDGCTSKGAANVEAFIVVCVVAPRLDGGDDALNKVSDADTAPLKIPMVL
jgi:hypothetical protein